MSRIVCDCEDFVRDGHCRHYEIVNSDTDAILNAVVRVYQSLSELQAEWDARDGDGSRWAYNFPFDSSLEDVMARIAKWIDTLEGSV